MVLKSRVEAPDWSAGQNPKNEAKCRKHPLPTHHNVEVDTWFHDMEEAPPICNGTYDGVVCPFREQCLYGALVNNEQSGVFGGFLPVQRRWIRRQRNVTVAEGRINPGDWEFSDEWRDRVPDLLYFDELERMADAESEVLNDDSESPEDE